MSVLKKEIRMVQNPALGSMLLWRFTCGYDENPTKEPVPFPLLFIVLPMIFQEDIYGLIKATQKGTGLRGFADKFSQSKVSKHDILLNIHDRAMDLRSLTLESLRLSLSSKLMVIDVKDGTVFPISTTPPKLNIPVSIKDMLRASEKLGHWCAQLSIHEISIILKVVF